MGRRRRSQKKVAQKKRATVSKVFKCPFCSMEDAVSCKIDVQSRMATLTCRVCAQKYQTANVSYLTEPIDVFCEWLDRCHEANEEEEGEEDDYDD